MTRGILMAGLALALAATPAFAQQKVARGGAIAPDAQIRIWNAAGSIRLIAWDRDSIAVTGDMHPGGGELLFAAGGGGAKIGVDGKGGADLEVRAPRSSTIWVKTASADILARDFSGALDLHSVTGTIRVEAKPRQLTVESMGGNLELDVIAPFIRARTGSGSIALRGSGKDVTLSTVDGGMHVVGTGFERGHVETIAGRILFEGSIAAKGWIDFQSHDGPIELRLPAKAGLNFRVSTYGGSLQSEFPLPKSAAGDVRGREVEFSTAGGGARVVIRTYKGAIVLRRQRAASPTQPPDQTIPH